MRLQTLENPIREKLSCFQISINYGWRLQQFLKYKAFSEIFSKEKIETLIFVKLAVQIVQDWIKDYLSNTDLNKNRLNSEDYFAAKPLITFPAYAIDGLIGNGIYKYHFKESFAEFVIFSFH